MRGTNNYFLIKPGTFILSMFITVTSRYILSKAESRGGGGGQQMQGTRTPGCAWASEKEKWRNENIKKEKGENEKFAFD